MFSPFPREALDHSIPARFREQAERHAGRPAVRYDGAEVTYRDLRRRVIGVAALVRRAGAMPGAVALLVPQGIEQIAGVLGVLEAGGWYVPLDPADSEERLKDLVARCEARLVLAAGPTHARARAIAAGACPVARIEDAGPADADERSAAIPPEALAYVYFTSGTTGRPKGVMDSHRNVMHNVLRYTNALRWSADDRLTLLQSSHFSGAVSNVFGALLNGALLLPYDVPRDGAGPPLARWIERERPTIYHSVPSLFRGICRPGFRHPSVRVVRLEGDAAAPGDLARFAAHFAPDAVLVHGLGATETGICRQHFARAGDPAPGGSLPVGGPVEDMEVRIVNEQGDPLAAGETGEIAVRSRFLALGYWRDPERTAAAFRPDPADPSLREYRTGDLGRMSADGCLEHLGRRDLQLKLRGAWVDAARVESALAAIPGVAEAAVAVQRGAGDEAELVAYVTPDPSGLPTLGGLRRALAGTLPAHALPTRVVALERLPLGPNGKLDRRALAPGLGRPLSDGAGKAPPRDAREAALASIWSDVLGVERVGIHDPFVELGGDSLRAVEVSLAIEQRLGVTVPHSVLAELPTIAALAERLGDPAPARASGTRVPVRTTGTRPPLFCVHDLESDAFLFAPLAHRLGAGQPLYGLRAPAGEAAGRLPRTIAGLAARHLADVAAIAPAGPYQLAGFCFGAVVALEMARQLAGRGERVALLALFNVTPFDLFPLVSARARRRFRGGWGRRLRYVLGKPDAARWAARRLARVAGDAAARAALPWRRAALDPLAPADPALLRATLREAFRRHVPRPHDGPLVLFLAEETLPLYADDPREAWAGLASGPLEIHRLPRDGYAMLSEPDVARLAAALEPHLVPA